MTSPAAIFNRSPDQAPATSSAVSDALSKKEFGRTFYHQDGKYLFPTDRPEQTRLDLQHMAWVSAMDGALSFCPATKEDPKNVLDLCTGTGIWAIQFAEQHPASTVTGTDISMIQPAHKPANCTFYRHDAEQPWQFEKPFDYVHLRLTSSCFGDHRAIIRKIFDNLRPGGWIEYHEGTPNAVGADAASEEAMHDPYSLRAWWQRLDEGLAGFGKDVNLAYHCKDWLEETGFVDVVETRIMCPFKDWPADAHQRETGSLMYENFKTAVDGTSVKTLQGAGMSVDEIKDFVSRVREHTANPSLRLHYPLYVVCGRKPSVGKSA